jgi:hypothetical protein
LEWQLGELLVRAGIEVSSTESKNMVIATGAGVQRFARD